MTRREALQFLLAMCAAALIGWPLMMLLDHTGALDWLLR